MLASDYDGLELPQSLCTLLEKILSRYEIPDVDCPDSPRHSRIY